MSPAVFRADSNDEGDAITAALVAADHAQGKGILLEGADGTLSLPARG